MHLGVFLPTPHGVSPCDGAGVNARGRARCGLSRFRLKNLDVWAKWYGMALTRTSRVGGKSVLTVCPEVVRSELPMVPSGG